MLFDDHMGIASSFIEFQCFLDALDIYLCQHTRMSDLKIAAKLYKIYSFHNHTGAARDALEAYVGGHCACNVERCAECQSLFKVNEEAGGRCHILVKRYLGSGNSAYDKSWLAQCGEEKHRLRSLGAAAVQGLKRGFGK